MKRFLLILIPVFLFLFITPSVTHAQEIITDKKLITVDTGKQKLYAWEGGRIQFETLVSTGMRYTPTVKGTFSIRRKVDVQDMKGSFPPYEPYYIKNVKHVMYFYGAYAIHGAHWHNKFGSGVSHGCVNLPPAAAEWVYNWADIGTPVIVF
jgi:lipoprotein-anchoring transpeptidase ErfK/SrfK